MWAWLCSRGLGKLFPPILHQNQVPAVGLDCHSTLQEAESSIWAQQWPIKSLKGLVRNLLAVSRWGVLGWAWLWSVTEVTLEQAEERETIDDKSCPPQKKINKKKHVFTLLFHTCAGITMHTLPRPHKRCVWPEFQPKIYKHCFHMFLYVCAVRLGKWLLAYSVQEGVCFLFITFSPLNKPPVYL